MSDAELIARLRNHATDSWHYLAADRIEALKAENRRLEAKANALVGDKINLRSELMATQAKLARAVEALTAIDALDPEGMIDGCSQAALRGLVLRMGDLARTAIAELKGEKDGQ